MKICNLSCSVLHEFSSFPVKRALPILCLCISLPGGPLLVGAPAQHCPNIGITLLPNNHNSWHHIFTSTFLLPTFPSFEGTFHACVISFKLGIRAETEEECVTLYKWRRRTRICVQASLSWDKIN